MDLREYLERNLVGKVSAQGWYNCACLNPNHHDSHPSFGIDLSTGHGYCFSCQVHYDLPQIVALIERKGIIEAAVTARGLTLGDASLKVRSARRSRRADYHPFWESRGIRLPTVVRHELGYDEGGAEVYGPVHDLTGVLVGFVKRSISSKQYRNEGFESGTVLYNYHRLQFPTPVLYVAEGWIDTLSLDQAGYTTVGRFGVGLSEVQRKALDRTGARIVMLVDNDHLGLRAADGWVRRGYSVAFARLPYKDPNDELRATGTIALYEVHPLVWRIERMKRQGLLRS